MATIERPSAGRDRPPLPPGPGGDRVGGPGGPRPRRRRAGRRPPGRPRVHRAEGHRRPPRTHDGAGCTGLVRRDGLHRGDVVEQTPIKIGQPGTMDTQTGALALVRSGALYWTPRRATCGSTPGTASPRIVGHDSEAGPGGDPNGDIAAWFEGSDADALPAGPGELVVYDTAAGREISRTDAVPWRGLTVVNSSPRVTDSCRSPPSASSGAPGDDVYSHDVRSGTTSVVEAPENLSSPDVLDVHDQIEVFWEEAGESSSVVLRVPGRADERFPDLSPDVRLSPSGNYLLAVEVTDTETPPAAVIIDTRTGELWRLPETVVPRHRVVLRRHRHGGFRWEPTYRCP